jgi:ABC-type polysaccharide/polyol phosphate transport system ATPase subunit
MKNDPSIKVKNVTKTYKLYDSQADRVKEVISPFRKRYFKVFKALDDISIDIKKGETVGIIGRNGSGKSTLLQIISGVMKPTEGNVWVDGTISALLELGAGFNPEFTGRDNIYTNGAILGFSKKEIDSLLPEIISFANIGEFIDQPVKVYSSGMYVRLAFSIAINVKPDILIVDEALAVGDTLFQSKCFAKFREFQQQGVTILFVTHALDMITSYCTSAFLMEEGRLISSGDPKEVVDEYNRLIVDCKPDLPGGMDTCENNTIAEVKQNQEGPFPYNPNENRYGNGDTEIIEGGILGINDNPEQVLKKNKEYLFYMRVKFNAQIENPIFAYTIKDVKGFDISGTNTLFQKIHTGTVQKGEIIKCMFKHVITLNAGGYLLSLGCAGFENGEYVVYDRRYDFMSLEVVSDKPGVGFFDLNSEITIHRESNTSQDDQISNT